MLTADQVATHYQAGMAETAGWGCTDIPGASGMFDPLTQTVRLRGPTRAVDLRVHDPEQFKLVAVGDQVEATYTEAVAISVEPAGEPQ